MFIVIARKMKFAKVMFSQVSVCPQGGGCLPHCMLGYTPSRHLPLSRHSPGQTPPSKQTPLGQTPPGQTPPLHSADEIRSTSGWYASHWNAFLFIVVTSSQFFVRIIPRRQANRDVYNRTKLSLLLYRHQ